MMKCEDIRKNLDLFIDSEILSDEERKEISAHLDQCEDCKREYEEMRKIKEELKALGDVELPENFHDDLMNKLKGTNKKSQPFMQKHYKWFAAAAAVMLLGIMTTAGMLFLPFGFKSEAPMAMYEKSMDSNFAEPSAVEFTESLDYDRAGDGVYPEMELTMTEAVVEESAEERKIIKSIYIELDTQDIEMAFNSIHNQVGAIGGYVEYSNIGNVGYYYDERTKSQEEMRYASINVRVPSDQLDSMVAFVESLGEFRTKSLNTTDQTDYYYDIDNQIENLKVREKRLREIMDKAEDISDILEIERELSRVRNEIDGLTRNLKNIDKRVDYSSLTIQLREVLDSSKINPEDRNIFTEAKEGIIKNINRVLNFLQNSVIFVFSYIPIFILIGFGLGILYWIIKKINPMRWRKKNK
ncbi:MAG: DUF4349 domain-containing protein [Bacillota bacterium]|nr:DUF4349 domain-containing protein [Bacillota bacterium]